MPSRQLHLGAFMRPASIHTGAWRYPGAWPDMNFNLAHTKESIQKLEAAKFDALADPVVGPARTRELREIISGLDRLGDVGALARLAAG